MNSYRLRPKVVIRWGIATTAGAALLVILVPTVLFYPLDTGSQGQQDLLTVVRVFLQFASIVLPSLGAALIGAGIVMVYVERILTGQAAPAASSDNHTM